MRKIKENAQASMDGNTEEIQEKEIAPHSQAPKETQAYILRSLKFLRQINGIVYKEKCNRLLAKYYIPSDESGLYLAVLYF